MRRLATLLASLVFSGGVLLAIGATPAQAQYPGAPEGGTLRNVYSTGSGHCDWYGSYGVQNNMWDFYLCEVHPEYPYLEFLWSFDYE